MGDVTIEGDEQGRLGSGSDEGGGMDLSELMNGARELAGRAREWIAGNPFAALGIAVGTGFLVGRAMRMWVLRP
jgi:ElaB/YqjD/DUF883 family membrane-anchored ribosome-binding protein